MTKKDHQNRLKFLYDYLELIHRYPIHYRNNFGNKGLEDEINRILDEINFTKKQLIKFDKNDNQ